MKRSPFYVPLALAMVFGLVVGMISISPVYSDNIPGCQGTGSNTAKVILGGRVITPSTILRTANGQPCGTGEIGINMVSMTRTVVVSPNGTATQNGTALLSAMDTISNSNPSASNPWLLKLEPGNYDLGAGALTLQPYVDLEGSGEGTTTISSTTFTGSPPVTTATVIAASNSEMRFVTIVNYGGGTQKVAILVPNNATNARVTHVTALVNTGGSDNTGLVNSPGASVTVQESTFNISNGASNTGLINNGTTVTVQRSVLLATGNANIGLSNNSGTANIATSQLTSFTGAGTTKCVLSYNATFTTLAGC